MSNSYSINNAISDLKTLENIGRILDVAKDNVFADDILFLIESFEKNISKMIESQRSILIKTVKKTPPEKILEVIIEK